MCILQCAQTPAHGHQAVRDLLALINCSSHALWLRCCARCKQVVKGMVLRRDTEGTIKSVENAKVAVYAQGIDTASTDTKVRACALAWVEAHKHTALCQHKGR